MPDSTVQLAEGQFVGSDSAFGTRFFCRGIAMDTCRPNPGGASVMKTIFWITAVMMLLTGCGGSEDVSLEFGPYIDLDPQPGQLRDEFNAHADQLRLVFIVGPT